ncbi:MAG: tetratricopeptide repeat protein [Planctomycetota bacterium]
MEAAPGDTGSRMDLAQGYVVKLFTTPPGPEMGVWATKAEGQWQEVLKIDDNHWEARFSLGTSWSRYPEFLNKTPDAIREFKKLRDVQEKLTPEPQHAQTYVQLALLHTRQNNKKAAREALKAGLERHPDNEDIQKTLDSMK